MTIVSMMGIYNIYKDLFRLESIHDSSIWSLTLPNDNRNEEYRTAGAW